MRREACRVSVVVTSYNQKALLEQALDSVLAQTVPAHEILVADDGSQDGSPELIRDYMTRHPRLVQGVFQARNVGLPRNRNAALRRVTGNYVAILDGDDLFLPVKIERELDTLAAHPEARVVYSNYYACDANARPLRTRFTGAQPSGDVFVYVATGAFGLLRSMLIEYETLRRVGFMDETFENYDGYELTVRLAKHVPFAYCPEPLVKKRAHPGSRSKHIQPAVHLKRMRDLFAKIEPLLADMPAAERRTIERPWRSRIDFARRRQVAAEGRRVRALALEVWARLRGYS
jgi:glycosyltransferase involved in cell wall biosynthesis